MSSLSHYWEYSSLMVKCYSCNKNKICPTLPFQHVIHYRDLNDFYYLSMNLWKNEYTMVSPRLIAFLTEWLISFITILWAQKRNRWLDSPLQITYKCKCRLIYCFRGLGLPDLSGFSLKKLFFIWKVNFSVINVLSSCILVYFILLNKRTNRGSQSSLLVGFFSYLRNICCLSPLKKGVFSLYLR